MPSIVLCINSLNSPKPLWDWDWGHPHLPARDERMLAWTSADSCCADNKGRCSHLSLGFYHPCSGLAKCPAEARGPWSVAGEALRFCRHLAYYLHWLCPRQQRAQWSAAPKIFLWAKLCAQLSSFPPKLLPRPSCKGLLLGHMYKFSFFFSPYNIVIPKKQLPR